MTLLRILFSIGLAYALLAPGSMVRAAKPEAAAEAQIHRLVERIDLKPGQVIRVVNRYGNVRIREVPLAAAAELALTVQLEPSVENPVRTSTEMRADGVLVVGAESDVPLDGLDGFLRLDLTLAVPDNVELSVELENGDFTMPVASYPLTLRASKGSLRIRTSGLVDVRSVDGKIVYVPPRDRPIAGGRIESSTASVDVVMNDPDQLGFEVISGAAITTDSLAILQRREIRGRAHHFPGPDGTGLLNIQTDAAPIRLVFEGIR